MSLYAPAVSDVEFLIEFGLSLDDIAHRMGRTTHYVKLILARVKAGDEEVQHRIPSAGGAHTSLRVHRTSQ